MKIAAIGTLTLFLLVCAGGSQAATFSWSQTGTMVYDGTGADSDIDPYVVDNTVDTTGDINFSGLLTVQSGSLTINPATSWGDKIGYNGKTGTIVVNGGTLDWVVDNDNEDRIMMGNGTGGVANISVNGGSFLITGPGGYNESEQNVRFGSDGGVATLNLVAGTLDIQVNIPVAFGGKWTNVGTTWNEGTGVSVMNITDGSFVVSGGGVFGVGSNDKINFISGGTGALTINGWTSTDFAALAAAGKLQIDGVTVTNLAGFKVTGDSLSWYTSELIEDSIPAIVIGDMTDKITNPGFELPGTGDIKTNWDLIPGWTSLTNPPSDSGVIDGGSGANGSNYHGYIGVDDDAAYQIADVNIIADKQYTLKVQMRSSYRSERGRIALFYLSNPTDPNTRVILSDTIQTGLGGSYVPVTTSFTAFSAGAEVGQGLGILLDCNDLDGYGFTAFDEVQLYEYAVHGVIDQAPEGANVEPVGPLVLSWTPSNDPNLNGVGTDEQVLYYYIGNGDGLNPDYDSYLAASGSTLAYTAGSFDTTQSITTDQYCLWRVDTVIDGITYTGETILFTTRTADMAPAIQQMDWVRTWVDEPATIWADVNDFGEADIDLGSIAWTVTVGDPNLVLTDISTDPYHPEATVIGDVPGDYGVQLVVTDNGGSLGPQPSNTATYQVHVYADPCAAAIASGVSYPYYDHNHDCLVNIVDFADFALYWMNDISLTAPVSY